MACEGPKMQQKRVVAIRQEDVIRILTAYRAYSGAETQSQMYA